MNLFSLYQSNISHLARQTKDNQRHANSKKQLPDLNVLDHLKNVSHE
jgi:hypothetical protein